MAQAVTQSQDVRRAHSTAMVFAVVALVTLWIPPVSLGFGIAALVKVRKGRRLARATPEAPALSFTPQFVMGLIATVLGGLASIVFAISLAIALFTVGGVLSGAVSSQTSYDARFQEFEQAEKTFAYDETIEFGAYDLRIIELDRNYQPEGSAKETLEARLNSINSQAYYDDNDVYGQLIPEEARVYTKFTMTINLNEDREATYGGIAMDVLPWGRALDQLKLDGRECIWRSGESDDLDKYDNQYTDKYKQPSVVSYICIGDTAEPKEITLDVSAFSKMHFLVGTEGMPRTYFTYTITL